jgi:hypothetical protein
VFEPRLSATSLRYSLVMNKFLLAMSVVGASFGCGAVVDESDGAVDALAETADVADDASVDSWPDVAPATCNDIGNYPGKAACCNSSYCEGQCEYDACYCAGNAGCIWPAICCVNPPGCVGITVCKAW